jgi:selenocysteine lyase/cysteine desulfurase
MNRLERMGGSPAASGQGAAGAAGAAERWVQAREQMSLAPEWVHLAAFLLAPHPRPVAEAIAALREAFDANPELAFEDHVNEREQAVERDSAAFIGGRDHAIAITTGTTAGLSLVYGGLELAAGDEVITTTHEHYATHESLRLAAARSGAGVRKIALYEADSASVAEGALVDRLLGSIAPRTRALAMTWVHSSSGVKLPVARIARELAAVNAARPPEARVLLVLDAAHALGVEETDVVALGCDVLVAGCHKWLFGPRGTGLVWASDAAWTRIAPTIPSTNDVASKRAWLAGVDPPGPMTGRRLTPGGMQAYDHRWALPAAFAHHRALGAAPIAARTRELATRAKRALAALPGVALRTPLDPELSSGIVCFDVAGLPAFEVAERLRKARVLAGATPYATSHVRFGTPWFLTDDDIDRGVAAVKALGRG